MTARSVLLPLTLGLVLVHPLSNVASAALLTGTFEDAPATPANLTAQGTVDWAIWNFTSGNQSGAPSNEKLGGTSITTVLPIGGGGVRGVGGTSQGFSYTDGTSPTSQSDVLIGALANNGLDTEGRGYQFTVTGSTTEDRVVYVYLGGFGGTGALTATLSGAAPYTPATVDYASSNPKQRDLYTITFRPDNPGDVLTVSYVLSADNGAIGSSHVLLSAVAVAPEPASASVLALAAGGVLLARRRRRA